MVMSHGAINAAAAELNCSSAKVSRDLDSLEETVGQRVLIRSPRGVALTDFGTQLLSRVDSMVDTFGAMKADVAKAKAKVAESGIANPTFTALVTNTPDAVTEFTACAITPSWNTGVTLACTQ